jgi:hypothetical protein
VSGLTAKQRKEADAEQYYEWVMAEKAYGQYSREFFQALVRNARHRAIGRIIGDAKLTVVEKMRANFPELVEEYNKNARAYEGSYDWIVPETAVLQDAINRAKEKEEKKKQADALEKKKKKKQADTPEEKEKQAGTPEEKEKQADASRKTPSRLAKKSASAKK